MKKQRVRQRSVERYGRNPTWILTTKIEDIVCFKPCRIFKNVSQATLLWTLIFLFKYQFKLELKKIECVAQCVMLEYNHHSKWSPGSGDGLHAYIHADVRLHKCGEIQGSIKKAVSEVLNYKKKVTLETVEKGKGLLPNILTSKKRVRKKWKIGTLSDWEFLFAMQYLKVQKHHLGFIIIFEIRNLVGVSKG